jgi:hypothetical protein
MGIRKDTESLVGGPKSRSTPMSPKDGPHVPAPSRRRSSVQKPLSEGFSHFVASMTAPVASGWSVRRSDLVADQRLQDIQPSVFPRGRAAAPQTRTRPIAAHPTEVWPPPGAPLTRPTQPHVAQSDRHLIAVESSIHVLRFFVGCSGGKIEQLARFTKIVCISATLAARRNRSHPVAACVQQTECLFDCAD